jgi:ATP-dependent Clp protease ATP-binding subunit ClpC
VVNGGSLRQSFGLSIQGFTDRAVKVLAFARAEANERFHRVVTPEHVLLALAKVEPGPGRVTLERLGVELVNHKEDLVALVSGLPERSAVEKLSFSSELEQILRQAKAQARALGLKYVGTEHLVLALLATGVCPAAEFLKTRGVTLEPFQEELLRVLAGR